MNAAIALAELDNVALSCEAKSKRMHSKSAYGDEIAPAFSEAFVVGPFLHDVSLRSEEVFSPLLFNMNKGPLAAAEGEVLDSGKGEAVIFRVHDKRSRWLGALDELDAFGNLANFKSVVAKGARLLGIGSEAVHLDSFEQAMRRGVPQLAIVAEHEQFA